ncbi:amidohydrolase family protein [bacterium]|nr:amidohydrolase family protein [bacterium]
MKIFLADWILLITSPKIKNGAVVIADDGRIADVGIQQDILKKYSDKNIQVAESKNTIIMPGLVNAHTHLELSMMKGVIPRGLSFSDWVFEAITKRLQFNDATISADCEKQIHALEACGTVAVGDIANHSATSMPLLEKSSLYAVVFNEVTGFSGAVAQDRFQEFVNKISDTPHRNTRQALAPHAPYSVSPELFRLIAAYNSDSRISTVHLAESKDEIAFLQTGSGSMKEMIQKIGRWDENWKAPKTTPVSYLKKLGILNSKLLIVHAVHVTDDDIELLRSQSVHICSCPRSNVQIDVGGTAPIEKYLNAGLNVCLGTDSLASNDDLNLWNEMTFFKSIHPAIPNEKIIEMATINGARVLGFDSQIGSIEKGKDAALIRVESNKPIDDPESFVLSGYDRFSAVHINECAYRVYSHTSW